MGVVSISFEDLKARTYSALAQTSRAGLALRRASYHIRLISGISFLSSRLKQLRKGLTPQIFGKLSPEEAAQMACLVEELYRGINEILRLSDQKGLSKRVIYEPLFVDIRRNIEGLGDVLESYHLSLSSDFRKLVEDAIKELKITPRPADWRSSLAAMQDRH